MLSAWTCPYPNNSANSAALREFYLHRSEAELKFSSSLRDVREAIEQKVDDVSVNDAVLG